MKNLQRIGAYFINSIGIEPNTKTFLLRLVDYIKNSSPSAKYLLVILFPIAYVLDVIRLLFLAFLYGFRSAIGYIFIVLQTIKRAIGALVLWGLKLSDKYIVSFSFRLALILSLASTVILNRYQPIFKEYEESTAVFEFLASSIIIPMIFEWIYSIRSAK